MKYISIGITVIMALLVTAANATVWYVHPDSTMNCIQHCLDSCSTGDTVLVGPGLYSENITWPSTQGIDLVSQYGVDMTYIDGGGTGIVMEIGSGVDSTTIISGFTIQDGLTAGIYCTQNSSPIITGNTITGTTSGGHGGGIYCYLNSSPTITGNTITGNNGMWAGGIECNGSSPTINGNTITGNTAYRGGGISCYYSSSPIITYNTITQNTAQWSGGGIWCTVNCSPTITGNTIDNNTVTGGGEDIGGGISCAFGSSPVISNNTISNNSAYAGGGIFCYDHSSPSITDNTISNNTASAGGGIFCDENSSPSITENEIAGNTVTAGGGGILVYEGGCAPTITDNTLTYNTADGGGGIALQTTLSIVANNLITDNTANFGGGIHCTVDDSSTITGNTITDNTANNGGGISCKLSASPTIQHCIIEGNYGDGIYCFENANPIIDSNNIIDNIGYGIRNISSITINAENNWWGHTTGPYHSTNPGGLGDTVSDYVDFSPWLPEPGVEEYTTSSPVLISLQVMPNPFSKLTTLSFSIEQSAKCMAIQIYDVAGRLVKNLYDAIPPAPCAMQITWDGRDNDGTRLPEGTYFCRIKVGDHELTQKVILVK